MSRRGFGIPLACLFCCANRERLLHCTKEQSSTMIVAKYEWIFLMAAAASLIPSTTRALSSSNSADATGRATRRAALGWMAGGVVTATTGWGAVVARAADKDLLPGRFNVDDYLKTGMVMNPMGVSGQAGA